MSDIKSVCVYCGSSSKVDEKYKQAARDVGRLIAERGWVTVYGGSATGLMGLTADAALAAGGEVIGAIPSFLHEREVQHTGLTELHVVDTMHERKQKLVDLSDGFVILPGGLGTMDEFFEILTWRQLGVHDKPIVVVNLDGYWDSLKALVDKIVESGFARESDRDQVQFAARVEDVPELLLSAPPSDKDLQSKWI